VQAQHAVDEAFGDRAGWARRALRNIAGMGGFSVDRTIREYQSLVWNPPT
jgi:starch phosphorylase